MSNPVGVYRRQRSGKERACQYSTLKSSVLNFIENLPRVFEFNNLHITQNLKEAREALKDIAGVYVIICTATNIIYVGSSINLGVRMMDHIMESSNIHLRNAINKYGIESFVFIVVELFEKDPDITLEVNKGRLLKQEQFYLDSLFKLPSDFRYNYLSVAGSSLGYRHNEETRLKKQ